MAIQISSQKSNAWRDAYNPLRGMTADNHNAQDAAVGSASDDSSRLQKELAAQKDDHLGLAANFDNFKKWRRHDTARDAETQSSDAECTRERLPTHPSHVWYGAWTTVEPPTWLPAPIHMWGTPALTGSETRSGSLYGRRRSHLIFGCRFRRSDFADKSVGRN